MEITLLLIKRLAVMFIFMGIGTLLFKKKYISEEGSKTLANILIRLVLPCVIINGFITERTAEKFKMFLISFAMAVVLLTLSVLVSRFVFKKDPIAHFASSFSNPGFFGIPLIMAILSGEAVFYVAPFIACLNIGQWTYGVAQLKGEKVKVNVKNILLSPFMIAFILGLVIFSLNIPIPGICKDVISGAAGLNTPISMMVSGVYLAKVDPKKMIKRMSLYGVSALRLILIPVISALIISLVPNAYMDLKLSILIASACPVGSNVAVYAQLHGKDYAYAVETVVMSTIFSVVTIPVIIAVMQMLWQ
ncbi:MAG: AEC family transporter [Lachnospiraceae bacterium]|nr:AEC family transporter [Lachnospiraceae bacterium]